ncbi:MAG: hypothetical protein IJP00_05390 [Firmicutes bacterium]|nr:hypothetical protein [Bacillota bacterium]
MNNRFLNSRFNQIVAIISILVLILCIRLFVLTVVQHDTWSNAAANQNTKEITTTAPRGEILDRYGRVIATNKQVFTVEFNVSGLSTEQINDAAYGIVKILERNGDEYVDNFPILISSSKDGYTYSYTYDQNKQKWLAQQGFSSSFTPEQSLNALRNIYDIDPEIDRYEAVKELQTTYGVWPPINVRSMTYTYDLSKKYFLQKYGLDEDLDAEEAFKELRKEYKIDENLSDLEARKIFRIREEIKSLGYNKYRSSTIATDVSDKTVIYVEEQISSLPGVEIGSDSIRYYPNGSTLAHVIGYMGSISDSQYQEYVVNKGYLATDLIGKDGIEASMESVLKGTDGVTTVRVDSGGSYIETISKTDAEAGKNVYLTVDLNLQKVAENALANGIKAVSSGTVFKGKYGSTRMSKYSNCQTGAVVAIEVETGDVLAMASYPDYDPNIFAQGISNKDWASVQSVNPRDYLAPTPLYNIATKTSVQPGSTFKPVTSIAALQCGLDPDMEIYDKGYVKVGNRTFGCDTWNTYRGSHGWEDLSEGIQNSCNFYFYCIATGTNWNNGKSLGYSKEITIEKIMEVAKEFGLGEKTGIELDEGITSIASAEKKMAGMKNSLWYHLYNNAHQYWPESIVSDEEKLRKDINTITSWIEENPSRGEIIKRIEEQTSVLENKVETVTDVCKYSYFNQAQWTIGDEFNISIGMGDNAYTPLQMANYVATLGNNGNRNQVNIVKGIEGEGETVKKEPYQIDVSSDDVGEVLKGMRKVVTGGTLAGTFRNFKYEVAGKTGTAEKQGYIQPKDEVAYVKKYLSRITSKVSWSQVETEMKKLMKDNPEKYPTENDAVDQALINASGKKVTYDQINRYKDTYDSFAWVITLAPADDPKIAVVVLLVQGGVSFNAAPIAREVIGTYLDGLGTVDKVDLSTNIQ